MNPKFQPCRDCSDPLHCGSWSTCYAIDPDAPRFMPDVYEVLSRDQSPSVVSSADRAVYKHPALTMPYGKAKT